jgi:outer membrane biosynthesis protein TonB
MNREDLRAQIQAAAVRLTDELVGYFGEMLQSVVKDVTVGVADAKPLQKATVPAKKAAAPKPAPKKAAKPAAKPAPKKAAKPAAKPAPKKVVAPKPAPKKAAPPKPAIKKAAAKPAKPAAPKAAAKPAKPAKPAAKPAPAPKAAGKSGRRSIKELDLAADKVAAFLKDRGAEMRIEEINKALGTSTRELMRPIKKLLSTGQIQKRGDRRSTTYFAT